MQEMAARLANDADSSAAIRTTEADLRFDLYGVLKEYAVENLGLPLGDVRQEGTSLAGRFDSMFGRCVIEYKKPHLLDSMVERSKAATQAIGYLEDASIGASVVIVTDGVTWGLLRDMKAGPEEGEQGWFDLGEGSKVADNLDRFTWRQNGPDAAERVLTLMATLKAVPVNALFLSQRLGPTRPEVQRLLSELSTSLQARSKQSRADILFRQWMQMAGVSYGIGSPEQDWPKPPKELLGDDLGVAIGSASYAEAIFLLHTYVAFASKLIAAEVLALVANVHHQRPTEWTSLSRRDFDQQVGRLERGEVTDALRAPDLLAGDLFGWYTPGLRDNEALSEAVRSVISAFSEMAWARLANARGVAGDLLREFYASVVPPTFRKALGEFFTPQWVAERVLLKGLELAGFANQRARILDPSCGSGTFLVAALRRAVAVEIASGKGDVADAVAAAIENVIGFDINPVSTLMSRVNLLLALGDYVEHLPTIGFHIYETDSILLPDPVKGQGNLFQLQAAFMRIPLEIGNIDIPTSMATLPGLQVLRANIEGGLNADRTPHRFRQRLSVDLKSIGVPDIDQSHALDGASAIYEAITDLKKAGKNGIWARIIEQAFAPSILGQVDLVVGNPPWISWKHLPESWQVRSESTWRQWGLWQGRRRSAVPLADISSLLLARSVATYCPSGVVALLLPESILVADPGSKPIRHCNLRPPSELAGEGKTKNNGHRFRPLAVDDFTMIKPFSPDAANMPIALYLQSGNAPAFPIPKFRWTRVVPGTRIPKAISWSTADAMLASDAVNIAPIDDHDVSSPWAPIAEAGGLKLLGAREEKLVHYKWGQGFHTRGADGLYFCRVITDKPMGQSKLVRIRSCPEVGSNTRSDLTREAEVEAEFLWPMVRGSNVDPFAYTESGLYCIVPYDLEGTGDVLSVSQMMQKAPHLYDYLEPWIPRFKARSAYQLHIDDEHPWPILGPWTHLRRDRFVVMSRYMHPAKRPPAAVAAPTLDSRLGIVTTVYPNNKVNFISTHSEDEAHYLSGWVNSDPALTAISRFVSSTTIAPTALQKLPIPQYDPANPDHLKLSNLAKRCSKADCLDPERAKAIADMDQLVFAIAAQILPQN
jgi:hypothetical protein